MNNYFPCKCGHVKSVHEHRDFDTPILRDICWECMRSRYELKDKDIKDYHKFKPDNLKYLESIYEEKTT